VTTFAEDPRQALRERLATAYTGRRPIDPEDLVGEGLPPALAELIASHVVEDLGLVKLHVDRATELAVFAFAPSIAEWFGLPDLSDRHPVPNRPGPEPGRSQKAGTR
jgi:hypothetical protein